MKSFGGAAGCPTPLSVWVGLTPKIILRWDGVIHFKGKLRYGDK